MLVLSMRVATIDDIEAITQFQLDCWRDAFGGVLPASYQDPAGVAARRRRWADRVVARSREVRIALDGTSIVGLVSWGPGATGDHEGMELKDLHVDGSHHGTGLAAELLDLVPSSPSLFLWALTEDPETQRFYESSGFAPTGAKGSHEDTGVPVVMMVRD